MTRPLHLSGGIGPALPSDPCSLYYPRLARAHENVTVTASAIGALLALLAYSAAQKLSPLTSCLSIVGITPGISDAFELAGG